MMNISDSVQGKSGIYAYPQTAQSGRTDNKPTQKAAAGSADASRSEKLAALKSKMQSSATVDLNSLGDSMLKKGAFIDVKA